MFPVKNAGPESVTLSSAVHGAAWPFISHRSCIIVLHIAHGTCGRGGVIVSYVCSSFPASATRVCILDSNVTKHVTFHFLVTLTCPSTSTTHPTSAWGVLGCMCGKYSARTPTKLVTSSGSLLSSLALSGIAVKEFDKPFAYIQCKEFNLTTKRTTHVYDLTSKRTTNENENETNHDYLKRQAFTKQQSRGMQPTLHFSRRS